MNIFLNDIKYYYLTCDSVGTHAIKLKNRFSNNNLTEVNPIMNIRRFKSGASGFIRMIEKAITDCKNKFEPFILLEDDVDIHKAYDSIDIPNDAELLYIGVSSAGFIKGSSLKNVVYHTYVNDNIVKIYNMLATHGIMVCSLRGALMLQRCMMESYFNVRPWDIPLVNSQPYYNIYSLVEPYVYQDCKRNKSLTKLTFNDIDNKTNNMYLSNIPDENIIKTSFGFLTKYDELNEILYIHADKSDFGIDTYMINNNTDMLNLLKLTDKISFDFKPFCVVYENYKKLTDMDLSIIPKDADLLYIGNTNKYVGDKLSYTKNGMYAKIYNMIVSTGFVVCSTVGLYLISKSLSEAYYTKNNYNIILAKVIHLYNVYAFTKPIICYNVDDVLLLSDEDSKYNGNDTEITYLSYFHRNDKENALNKKIIVKTDQKLENFKFNGNIKIQRFQNIYEMSSDNKMKTPAIYNIFKKGTHINVNINVISLNSKVDIWVAKPDKETITFSRRLTIGRNIINIELEKYKNISLIVGVMFHSYKPNHFIKFDHIEIKRY